MTLKYRLGPKNAGIIKKISELLWGPEFGHKNLNLMNWVILSKVLRNVDELHYKSVIECVKLLVVSIDKKVKCVVSIYLGTAAMCSLFIYVQCF